MQSSVLTASGYRAATFLDFAISHINFFCFAAMI